MVADMKMIFIFLILITCTGCSQKPVTENIANSVIESLDSIEKTLPKECKTESVIAQINGAKAQIPNIVQACNSLIDSEKQKTKKWTLASIFEFGIIALLVSILFKRGLK